KQIVLHLQRLRERKQEIILCGDWNIAHQEIDLKNWRANEKNSGFLPQERQWLTRVFDETDFVDGFRRLNQKPDQYTWWSYRGRADAKTVGWGIDYQIATPGSAASAARECIYKRRGFLWAPIVDNVRLPLIGRFGQRRSWLWLVGVLVMLAVAFLGVADPGEALYVVAIAAITLGVAGATFDIIIDAYRIELLEPRQLGVGSGMSQYGWRIGAAAAGALALVLAARLGWGVAYIAS